MKRLSICLAGLAGAAIWYGLGVYRRLERLRRQPGHRPFVWPYQSQWDDGLDDW